VRSHDPAQRARLTGLVAQSIRIRVAIYVAIFVVTTVIVVVESVGVGPASVVPVLACAAGGLLAGVLASRMFAMTWDNVSGRVIGRVDALGVVILVGYAAFQLLRSTVVDLWWDGPVLAPAGLAALAAAMAGQAIGTRKGVVRVLAIIAGRAGPEPGPGGSEVRG
jgi:hypothetical protein